jgi:3-phosphoshikimate 1-carboxyvinyltransferase
MTSLNLRPGKLPQVINLPSSKSYANRALILAALEKKSTVLLNIPEADDVRFLIEALRKIGLKIDLETQKLRVLNSFPECEKNLSDSSITLDVGEGGTTARFLAVFLALGQKAYTLNLGTRLAKRPWNELIEKLQQLGAKANLEGNQLFIQGPLRIPEILEIDCALTTQVATAFQLALASFGTLIKPLNLKSSESYWLMTQEIIKTLKEGGPYSIPLDWSSASYPLVFGALKQEIFFPGLYPDPLQADSKLYSILDRMGAVTLTKEGMTIKPGQLQGSLKLNCEDCLDLVPALVFYLCHIEGVHELNGLENLIHKESDRLDEVFKLMEKIKIKSSKTISSLVIHGKANLQVEAMNFVLPDDHRMVMTAALFLRLHSGGTLSPASAVSKSFPSFFQLMIND